MELKKDSGDLVILIALIGSTLISYKVSALFPVLFGASSGVGITGRKWVAVFVVSASLVSLEFGLINPLQLAIISLASGISLLYQPSYTLWLTLGASILVLPLEPQFQVLSLISLMVVMTVFQRDTRGFIISGISLLLLDSITNLPGAMDVSYFDLLVGVLGVTAERASLPRRAQYLVPLAPAVLYALLGKPTNFYWADTSSFLFKFSPFSLWLPGTFYDPRLNQFLLFVLFDKPFPILMFVLVYLSGLISYYSFRYAGIKHPLVSSFIYSLLFPFNSPYLIIPFLVSPVFLLMKSDRKHLALTMPLVAVSSTTVLFPAVAYGVSLLSGRGKYTILYYLGASLFWLLPYSVYGFPREVASSWEFIPLLAAIGVISLYLGGKKMASAILIVSSTVMASGLPFSYALYPLVVLSAIYLVMSLDHSLSALVMAGVFISLLISQGVYVQSAGVAPSIHIPELGEGYVYWEGNYSLLSPLPLTNYTFADYLVNVTSEHGNVTAKVTEVKGENPYFQAEVNYTSPISLIPENSSITEENGFALWNVDNGSLVVDFQVPLKWVELHTNESVNVGVQYENGSFVTLKGEENNFTSPVSFLELHYPGSSVINLTVTGYNGKYVRLIHILGVPSFNLRPIFDGIEVTFNSSYPFSLRLLNFSGLTFYENGKVLTAGDHVFDGRATVIGTFSGETLFYVGALIGILFYVAVFVPFEKLKGKLERTDRVAEDKEEGRDERGVGENREKLEGDG